MSSDALRGQGATAARSGGAGPSDTADRMWRVRDADGSIAAGWYLLPLRAFLGVTFLFAGLQKLANPAFFRTSSPGAIHAQMVGGVPHQPHRVASSGTCSGASTGIGVVIALAEVAIGVGALLGLLTRVAAVGGVLVSFSLFLAISFHTSPYYTGSDIVFMFAWMPFVLAGAAGAPALDTWTATRAARTGPTATGGGDRPGAVSRGAVIGMVAGAAAVVVAVVTGIGRALAPSSSTAATGTLSTGTPTSTAPTPTTTGGSSASTAPTTTSTGAVPEGTSIGPASGVPVGGSASFNDPSSGDPSLVIQQTSDDFVAFDAICPHAGCTVAYQASAKLIACPCHGSEFDARTGAVIQGPATTGLTPIKVVKGSNGNLYVV